MAIHTTKRITCDDTGRTYEVVKGIVMQYRISQLIGAQLAVLGGVGVVMSWMDALRHGHQSVLMLCLTAVMAIVMGFGLALIFEEPSK